MWTAGEKDEKDVERFRGSFKGFLGFCEMQLVVAGVPLLPNPRTRPCP
jgi:hypothetical protein